MKHGTLVMLRAPSEEVAQWMDTAPHNGAIGEVLNTSRLLDELENGQVAVLFPSFPSHCTTKSWAIFAKWLIPLSDPDIDVGEIDDEVKGKITEHIV